MATPVQLKLRCQCGKVQGRAKNITVNSVNHVACYCEFCQSYVHHLGRAEDVLDEQGGTDVFQLSPRDVEFTQGLEQIDCLKLTNKGAFRWYAKCCNTPIATTTQNLNVPFLAINHACVEGFVNPVRRDAVIGPVRVRVNGHGEAYHKLGKTGRLSVYKMLIHMARLMLVWTIRSDSKYSPFRNSQGLPIVTATRVKVAR